MEIFGYGIIKSKKLEKVIIENTSLKTDVRTLKEEIQQLQIDLKTVQMLWDIEQNNTINNR